MRKNDQLKVIGLIVMVVDHFSLFLFGGNIWLYSIARFVGFPFFAYGVATGARYTRDPVNYLKRLLIFGLICQPVFFYATDQPRLNVCFTLALGVLSVRLYHSGRLPYRVLSFLIPLLGGPWSDPFVGYGAYGVYMILFFGIGQSASLYFHALASAYFVFYPDVQTLAIFSLLFIYYIPVPKLVLPRWVYYSSYPGHLSLICLLKVFS